MSKPWQTKEWIEKRKAFIEGKVCEWCGSDDNLVIHHKSYVDNTGEPISDEQYLDLREIRKTS